MDNTVPVYPKFVHHITEKLLIPTFSVTGKNLKRYVLYDRVYNAQRVFHRRQAFTMVFTKAVYETDWDMIESEIKSDWCSQFGMKTFL